MNYAKMIRLLLSLMFLILIGCQQEESGKKTKIETIDGTNISNFRVPAGESKPILLDGLFSEREWSDAQKIICHDSIELNLKIAGGYLFIGLNMPKIHRPSVDLYFGDSLEILQCHSSAQLSEKVLAPEGEEDPPFIWGKTSQWYANEFRWDWKKQNSLEESGMKWIEASKLCSYEFEGFEYQFELSKFISKTIQFRFEVMYYADTSYSIIYPTETEAKKTSDWLTLEL